MHLTSLARQICAADRLPPLLQVVADQLRLALDVHVAEIWLSDEQGQCLKLTAYAGDPDDAAGARRLSLDPSSQASLALERGAPVAAGEFERDESAAGEQDRIDLGIASALTAPVEANGEVLGALWLHCRDRRVFDDAARQFVGAVGTLLGLALRRFRQQDALRADQRRLLDGVVRDLVERREIETALRQAEDRCRELQLEHTELERVAVAGELAGTVAHEIRTPLNALSINVQMLERVLRRNRAEDLARAKSFVGTLREEVDRINALLTDYLQVLRRPAHHDPEVFALGPVVEDAIRFVEPKARSSGVTFAVHLSGSVDNVRGHEDRLRQVLLNLFLNAIQAMPEGGVIRVSNRFVGQQVGLEIADTGPGIAPEELDRIFQPFVTSKPQGTGLGLTISKRLIEAMGGALVVSSSLVQGACFEIRLPLEPDPDGKPEP
jgi:signal transduction histidine kinase